MDFKKNLKQGRKLADRIAARRSVLMTFQIDSELRERANAKAKDCGVNLSEYLRRCIDRFVELPVEKKVSDALDSATNAAADDLGITTGKNR